MARVLLTRLSFQYSLVSSACRDGMTQIVRVLPMLEKVSGLKKRLGCHAGHQEVGRHYTGNESEKPLCSGDTTGKPGINLGFETQSRRHQKYKTSDNTKRTDVLQILFLNPVKYFVLQFTACRGGGSQEIKVARNVTKMLFWFGNF